MSEPPSGISKRRILTLIPASAVVISNMIGTGIFTTTGLMVEMGAGGGDILLGWFLGGVIALCGALCYGEIGAHYPKSGGEYYFLSRLIHPAVGFMSGWVSTVVGFAAPIAASAMAMSLYLGRIIDGWPVRTMAAVTILGLTVLHAYDMKLGSRVQTAITGAKVVLIVAFIVLVLMQPSPAAGASPLSFNPSFLTSSAFAVVLVFVSFAYSGWNAAAYIGAELKDPERILPWSLLIGTAIVAFLYVMVNVAYLWALPAQQLSGVEEVGHEVAKTLWGEAGARLVSTLIAVTLVVPISAMLMIGPRVAEAMALDGRLPAVFGRLNRHNVPGYAVAFQGLLACVVAVTSSFGPLLIYIGFTLNIFAALTVVSLFKLRRSGLSQVKTCVGYPIPPILFIAFALWITVWSIQSQPLATFAGLGTLAAAYVAYRWTRP